MDSTWIYLKLVGALFSISSQGQGHKVTKFEIHDLREITLVFGIRMLLNAIYDIVVW